jgi:thymidylate kinase
MNPFKISFSGSHGTGKTTAAKALLKLLTKDGYRGIMVPEVVRTCPFPVNHKTTPEAQKWIWDKQLEAETEAMLAAKTQGYDFVICDRSMVDCLSYAAWHKDKARVNKDTETEAAWKWVDSLVEDLVSIYVPSYDIVYLTKPDKRLLQDDGFRDTDKDWQMVMADYFRATWKGVQIMCVWYKHPRPEIKPFKGVKKCAEDVKALIIRGKKWG